MPDPEKDGRYPAVLEAFVAVTSVATGSMWMMREPELFKKSSTYAMNPAWSTPGWDRKRGR